MAKNPTTNPLAVGSANHGNDDLRAEADALNMYPADEERCVVRPAQLGRSYVEAWGQDKQCEQKTQHKAEAEKRAQPHRQKRAAAKVKGRDELAAIRAAKREVKEAKRKLRELRAAAGTTVARTRHDTAMYYVRMALLLIGDLVGVSGAAITLGEVPSLAILLAMSSAAAAVISGLAASPMKKYHQDAIYRQEVDDSGKDDEMARRHAQLVASVGLLIVITLAGGVLLLRWAVEGFMIGLAFTLITTGVALASWINTYYFTDATKDELAKHEKEIREAQSRLAEARRGPARSQFREETAAIESIMEQGRRQGEAAAHTVAALTWAKLLQFPAIVGHGWPAESGPTESDEEQDHSGESVPMGLPHLNGTMPEPKR